MVAITANVPDNLIGRDAFQEIFITGIAMPITKHTFFVNRIEDLADALRNAFRIANSGRKGPVLVDITKDMTAAMGKPLPLNPPPVFTDQEVQEVAAMINAAEKPVVYFGGGVAASDAGDELNQLIEIADIPATYTLMAAGIIGYENPRNLGLIGMHGSIASNKAVDRADLVLALGARFSDRVALNPKKFARKAYKIQVDIDTSELNKNVLVDIGVTADVKEFLTKLLPLIKKKDHKEWVAQAMEWKKKTGDVKCQDAALHPSEIIHTVCDLTDKETIYVTDVGQHQMWAAQAYPLNRPRQWLTSGGLGTMGFGLPAAIGAALANPDKKVLCFSGDGSLMMNIQEMATASENQLDIKIILMNNEALGLVYQQQSLFYKQGVFAATYPGMINFMQIAAGFGLETCDLNNEADPQAALQEIINRPGPALIHVRIDAEQKVYPMVPPGAANTEMVGE